MLKCNKLGDFKKYFNQNMAGLNMPAPADFVGNYNTALANAIVIVETMQNLVTAATMGMVVGATTGLEKLKVIALMTASVYMGAVIGSLAVASGRVLGCGSSLADFFVFVNQNRLNFKNSDYFFRTHPEIFDQNSKFRTSYHSRSTMVS